MKLLATFLLWTLHFLPLPMLALLGNLLGLLLWPLAGERRQVATTNLRLCFPGMSDQQRSRLVRRNFMAFGRSLLERSILWWSSGARIKRLVRVEGREYFEAAKGQPLILLTAHFVALDVGGNWLSQHTDVVTVYSKQKDPYFDKLFLQKRTRFGHQLLFSRQEGMRAVVKAIREGHPFYYFTDQDFAAKEALFIPFFGVPASTLTTVPRLAEMTGAKVVPVIIKVLSYGRGYELRFYPPWENYPTGDLAADTRRMNEFIEQRILEMPEQYFWPHKRFKTRPPGEARLYPE
jgi:KDO2-lipid IV(A) lauroyltransferase